jgi:hypothetical protein
MADPTVKSPGELTIYPDQLERILRSVREGSPEEEAEKRAKKERQERSRVQLSKAITDSRERVEANQDACDHLKRNLYGQEVGSAVFGQIHSDKMFHPICVHCFKEFEPVTGDRVPGAGGKSSGGNFGFVSE